MRGVGRTGLGVVPNVDMAGHLADGARPFLSELLTHALGTHIDVSSIEASVNLKNSSVLLDLLSKHSDIAAKMKERMSLLLLELRRYRQLI